MNVTDLKELADLIERSIHDDAPVQLKEGRTFKKGVDKELDELISITTDGKKWLLEYEENQRNLTGIKDGNTMAVPQGPELLQSLDGFGWGGDNCGSASENQPGSCRCQRGVAA